MTWTAGTWIETLARRYGVGQGVRFLGRLPEGEYFRLRAGAGATVLPSGWPESLPTVAVESISLGGSRSGVWSRRHLGDCSKIKYSGITLPQPAKSQQRLWPCGKEINVEIK